MTNKFKPKFEIKDLELTYKDFHEIALALIDSEDYCRRKGWLDLANDRNALREKIRRSIPGGVPEYVDRVFLVR